MNYLNVLRYSLKLTKAIPFYCYRHANVVLTGASCVSTIASLKQCADDTRRYDKSKEMRREEIQSKLDSLVVFSEAYWRTGIITAVALTTSIASCAWSSNKINTLLLAYAALDKKFKKYKSYVATIDPDGYAVVEETMRQDELKEHGIDVGPGESLYYSPDLDMYFTSDPLSVEKAKTEINRILINNGWATLYDWACCLGIEEDLDDSTKAIAVIRGWCSINEFESGMKQREWLDIATMDVHVCDNLCTEIRMCYPPELLDDAYCTMSRKAIGI